jgi:hypothetical protein
VRALAVQVTVPDKRHLPASPAQRAPAARTQALPVRRVRPAKAMALATARKPVCLQLVAAA